MRLPNQVFCFIISIFVARELTPNDFGIMAVSMMVIGYANLFSNIGFCEAIIQKNITERSVINSIFTIDIGISFLLSVCFFMFSGFIASAFKSPECSDVIKVVSIVFIITSFEAISSAILRRDMNFKILSIIETFKSLSSSVLTLALTLLNFKYWALVYGQIVPLFIFTIILCYKSYWIPNLKYQNSKMIQVYNFGLWNFLKSQTSFLSSHLDKILIAKLIGIGPLGLYDKAMSISLLPLTSFTMNINAVMFSSFSQNQSRLYILREEFKKATGIISVCNFPIYIGLIIISDYFVIALLGYKWAPMITPFKLILTGCLVKSFGGLVANLNISTGQYKINSIFLMIATSIFFFVALFFTSFGIFGISIAFLLFCLIEVSMLMAVAFKKLELNFLNFVSILIPASVSSTIMYIACYFAKKNFVDSYTISKMIILIIVGAFTYLASFLIFNFKINIYLRETIFNDFYKKFMSWIK